MARRPRPDAYEDTDPDDFVPEVQAPRPWERQPGEPDEAFARFFAYLNAPEVPIAAYARASGDPCEALAATWRWRARKAQWTEALARQSAIGAAEGMRSLGERLVEAQGKLMDEVESKLALGLARDLKGMVLVQVLKYLSDQSALAEGRPTARLEVKDVSEAKALLRAHLAELEGLDED